MTEDSPGEHLDLDRELGFEPAVSDNAPAAADKRLPKTADGAGRLTSGRRRGVLRRKLTGVAVLIAALTTVGGGYALLAPTSGASDTNTSSQDIEQGRQLFMTSCITCHGANLQGVTGRGPTLVGVGSASVYFQVSTGRMPAVTQGPNNLRKPPKFTEQETRQLAGYVE